MEFYDKTPPEGGAQLAEVQFRPIFVFYVSLTPFCVRVSWFDLREVACELLGLFWVWVVAQSSVYEPMVRFRLVG